MTEACGPRSPGGDPLLGLWHQRNQLLAAAIRRQHEAETGQVALPDDETEQTCDALDAIERRIADLAATSAAGLRVQFDLLTFLIGEDEHAPESTARRAMRRIRESLRHARLPSDD